MSAQFFLQPKLANFFSSSSKRPSKSLSRAGPRESSPSAGSWASFTWSLKYLPGRGLRLGSRMTPTTHAAGLRLQP